jgi:TonB-linked SusC/RagA family outer membrane protein
MKKALYNAILLFVLTLAALPALAQKVTITGTVLDTEKLPLVGASVIVEGTTHGTTTDIDGKFRLEASEGQTLVINYLGYTPKKVKVGKNTTLSVVMTDSAEALDEVVVVGYGTRKKVNMTGSVATVDYSKMATSRPVTTTANILQGASAGLYVAQTSGQPGSEGVSMRIRGVGTLNDASPLVIVDGFEGTISNINPQDIASISVLKDAASCAIYGNRGANGVVLITTKQADKGKFNIEYTGMVAKQEPAHYFDVVSDYADYMEIMNESAYNVGKSNVFSQTMIDIWREKSNDPYGIAESGYPNYVAYPNVDWMRAIYKNSTYQKHSVSATGSTGGTRYLMSVSYMDNPGVIDNTALKQVSYRMNLTSQMTKWLEVGARIYGYRRNTELSDLDTSMKYLSRAVPCIYPYYDGKYGWMENSEQSSESRNNLYFFNRYKGSNLTNYMNASAFVTIKLPFNLKYNASFDYSWRDALQKQHPTLGDAYSFSRNEVAYSYNDLSKLTMTYTQGHTGRWEFHNTIDWAQTFGKHDFTAMIGSEALKNNTQSFKAKKTGFENDVLEEFDNVLEATDISGTQSEYTAVSVFGRVTYAYAGKYLSEVNMRYDGSSRFASRSRWGLFPSVSLGWRISQEDFMEDSGIDNLKLRLSWGKLGNNSIGNYDYQSTYASGYSYPFGGNLSSGTVSTLSNDLLEWETTRSYDVGLDLAVLKNRLTFEADYYDKFTNGILYKAPIYATIGNKSAPYQNLCEVSNRGFELTLGWHDRINKFSYGVSGNFTRNWNAVTKYKGALVAGWTTDSNGIRSYQTNIGDVTTVIDVSRRTMEGKLISEYYLANVYKGTGKYFFADGSVNPAGGPKDGMIRTEDDMAWLKAMVAAGNTFLPNKTISKTGIWYGDFIYADVNGDGVYGDSNDYTFQNVSQTPKYYYGLTLDMSWRGFDLSASFTGAGGGARYWRYVGFNAYSTDSKFNLPKDIAYDHYFYDPEDPEDLRTNLTSKNGRLTMNYGSEQNGANIYSNLFLYKTDYFRLRNLTLGYSIPQKLLKRMNVSNIRVFLTGDNLFTITDYPGIDPEFSDNMDYYAVLRQYTVGINIKF